jgi:RNA polymerase sigma-70 factor (ECF subfamily)
MNHNDKNPANKFEDFERVFQEHFTDLVQFAMTIVDSQDVAEDIVQEVFIKVWEKQKDTKFHKPLKGYLFISVKNACFTHVKRENRKSDQITELTPQAFDLYDTDAVEATERNRLIFEAIEKLSPKGKIVLKLICFDNLKYREVAEELGISRETVKYHFTHSLKRLRELLSEDHFLFFLHFYRKKKAKEE